MADTATLDKKATEHQGWWSTIVGEANALQADILDPSRKYVRASARAIEANPDKAIGIIVEHAGRGAIEALPAAAGALADVTNAGVNLASRHIEGHNVGYSGSAAAAITGGMEHGFDWLENKLGVPAAQATTPDEKLLAGTANFFGGFAGFGPEAKILSETLGFGSKIAGLADTVPAAPRVEPEVAEAMARKVTPPRAPNPDLDIPAVPKPQVDLYAAWKANSADAKATEEAAKNTPKPDSEANTSSGPAASPAGAKATGTATAPAATPQTSGGLWSSIRAFASGRFNMGGSIRKLVKNGDDDVAWNVLRRGRANGFTKNQLEGINLGSTPQAMKDFATQAHDARINILTRGPEAVKAHIDYIKTNPVIAGLHITEQASRQVVRTAKDSILGFVTGPGHVARGLYDLSRGRVGEAATQFGKSVRPLVTIGVDELLLDGQIRKKTENLAAPVHNAVDCGVANGLDATGNRISAYAGNVGGLGGMALSAFADVTHFAAQNVRPHASGPSAPSGNGITDPSNDADPILHWLKEQATNHPIADAFMGLGFLTTSGSWTKRVMSAALMFGIGMMLEDMLGKDNVMGLEKDVKNTLSDGFSGLANGQGLGGFLKTLTPQSQDYIFAPRPSVLQPGTPLIGPG